jgi:hypothetical protein
MMTNKRAIIIWSKYEVNPVSIEVGLCSLFLNIFRLRIILLYLS